MWSELNLEEVEREANREGPPRDWSAEEIEELIVFERLYRYNRRLPCGAAALRRRLDEHYFVRPLPSIARIGRLLTLYGLTHARTGWYDGDDPSWLPKSARVPKEKRRNFSAWDPRDDPPSAPATDRER